VEQTKKNRIQPRVECKQCGQAFATQWAEKPADKALPRGLVLSERFELGRNFCNKLWNAARFALLNLEDYSPAPVSDRELAVEDRWILSRLATVTAETTAALETYRYGDAARVLYDFAWNEFCSFYVEMVKGRLQDAASRPVAQRVLAHTLDALVRLLHPLIPFITEDIWQRLEDAAPVRGLTAPAEATESVMIATWPEVETSRQDPEIEARFAKFQELLKGLRDIRSRQNIKTKIQFSVRCDAEFSKLLAPMEPYFESMAGAAATAWGEDVKAPETSANFFAAGAEVFVDHIDVKAEIARQKKEQERLTGAIAQKEKQLSNESFVSRAPAAVIEKERAALAQLRELLTAAKTAIVKLTAKK
jgi:valyl-tRNA synthetase